MASRVLNYLISMFYTLKHKQYFGPGLRIKGRPRIKINGTLSAGGNIIINSGQRYNPIGGDSCANIIVEESGYLGLGDNVGMSNCTIYCSSKIVIGSNVLIGGGVKIYDTDFHSLSLKERLAPYNGGADNGIVKTKVCIEDGVFIGAHSLILKSVVIGANSVLGAGSVLTKSIPANEIWAGNPAKFVRKL